MQSTKIGSTLLAAASCLAFGSAADPALAAPALTTLVSFDGGNGSYPAATLGIDKQGNLYGTTRFGGPGAGSTGTGDGTVFELSKQDYGALVTLFAFSGADGANPSAALVLDPPNRLFGTTSGGGAGRVGTVFELSRAGGGTFTSLASLGGAAGAEPSSLAALPARATGAPYALYGTTIQGGAGGNGAVFELSGPGLTTLAATTPFAGSFAEHPGATLVAGPGGVLYGTDATGGEYGQGIVFSLSGPAYAAQTVLVTFNGSNGAFPQGALTVDADGSLYGTTSTGGPSGDGSVFELSGPQHDQLTTLAAFATNDPRGSEPEGSLLLDRAGKLYGTNSAGGASRAGSVFRISADHTTLTVLHGFTGPDGSSPAAGLVADPSGTLFGTTAAGGAHGLGTVFLISGAGFKPG